MVTQAQAEGLGLFANWGFTLYHPGDHTVALLHDERSIALFSRTEASDESIQKECAEHLVKCHGWDGCLWSRGGDTKE